MADTASIGSGSAHGVARVLASPRFCEPFTVLRERPGARNEYGEWIPGAPISDAISGVTLPASTNERGGIERDMDAEGLRILEVRKFYIDEAHLTEVEAVPLALGEAGALRIEYNGTTYRALMIERWGGYTVLYTVRPEEEVAE